MAATKQIDLSRPKTPRPTAQYILALREEAEQQSGPMRERWEEIRAVRNRSYVIDIPEKYKKTTQVVRTHYVGDIMRRVVAHLTLNMPTVAVPPAGEGDAHQRNSTLREKWTQALLTQLDADSMPDRWYRRVMDHAAGYGRGVLKCLFINQEWADMPTAQGTYGRDVTSLDDGEVKSLEDQRDAYKKGRMPIAVLAVDPRTWWGFRTQRHLRECIEWNTRAVYEVESQYRVRWNPRDKTFLKRLSEPYAEGSEPQSRLEHIKWTEHWNDTWVTYVAEDKIVQQWEHGYGKPPYFTFDGLTNGMADPGKSMESVVEHILDLVKLYDRLLTMWTNWAYLSSFPMGTVTAPPQASPYPQVEGAGEQQAGPEFKWMPGEFAVMQPGYEPGWLTAPPVGKDLIMVSEVIRSFLDQVIPNVLRGVGGEDQAGYAINQLITAAKLVFNPISDNAALAIQEMVKFIWWLIENKIREKVYVLGEVA